MGNVYQDAIDGTDEAPKHCTEDNPPLKQPLYDEIYFHPCSSFTDVAYMLGE